MGNNTFIAVPRDVQNEKELSRFLTILVEQVDIAFGLRGSGATASLEELTTSVAALNTNLQGGGILDLPIMNITISATYSQAEVQQLADDVKVLQTTINSILNRLRLAKIIV